MSETRERVTGGETVMKTKLTTHVDETPSLKPSPLDLIRQTGGVAHPIKRKVERPVDSMLAVYHDRCTYTFIMGNEVASVHFDRSKNEIFFSGHNIKNMQLSAEQIRALKDMQGILAEDEQGKSLFNDYVATLGHLLADNK